MQKEKKFEKIKKLLHQFKMRKVRFEEITYIKVKNIDDYIMNGEIITLQKRMPSLFAKEYATFMTIAADVLKENGDKNE